MTPLQYFLNKIRRSHILLCALFALAAENSTCTAQPIMSPPSAFSSFGFNYGTAQINVSNCYSTNALYLLQISTNLTDWITVSTTRSIGSNFSMTVPAYVSPCYYRLTTPFPFLSSLGIFCKNKLDAAGNNYTLDSFDSSTAAGGQYNIAIRQANGNIGATDGITNSLGVGVANIYGSVYAGAGASTNYVTMVGRKGSVGDLGWVTAGSSGIESGHWKSNLNLTIPDVPAPNTSGWSLAFPAPVNGAVMLTNAGAAYVVSMLPSSPLVVTAPTTIWVQGSASLGVTISNATWVTGGVTNTTLGQLILYVGQTSGRGNSLIWSGPGTCNVPGYAANLQIYGLPSLTSIDFHGNTAWVGTVYAPEAAFVVGGGGNNTQDTSGQIIVNSIALNGHWNFHYDQNLATLNLHP